MSGNGKFVCFLCRANWEREFANPVEAGHKYGLLKAEDLICPDCVDNASNGIALVSVTDVSFVLQQKAVTSHYHRRATGQHTPYPTLLVRTGLTVFVVDDYITKFLKASSGPSLQDQHSLGLCITAIVQRRWMVVPDSVFEQEGLLKLLPEDIVSVWQEQRKEIADG